MAKKKEEKGGDRPGRFMYSRSEQRGGGLRIIRRPGEPPVEQVRKDATQDSTETDRPEE